MRWTRLFLFVLAAIFLVIGAGVAFVWTVDLNNYKSGIEQFVSRSTGRVFSIEGRIDLDWGRHTGLTITGVHFGNPAWASSEFMASAERVHVVVDMRSLWMGPVIIDRLEIDRAQLNLEKQTADKSNWTFGDSGAKSDGAPLSFILRHAQVDDFELTIAVPTLDHPLNICVDRLDQVQNSGGLFDAKFQGTLNGRAVDVSGKYGPLESLLTAQNLTIDVAGQFDTLSITVSGLIDDLVKPRQPRGDIRITGPDIDDVTGMFGLPDLGSGDLDLAVSMQPDGTDLGINIVGRIGEHQFDTVGSVSDLIALDRVSMRLSARGPDLSKVARLFGQQEIPAGSYELSGFVSRDGAQLDFDQISLVIGAATLRLHGALTQFPGLNGANLSLDIRGEHVGRFTRLIGLPGVMDGPFEIIGQLEIDSDGVDALRLDAKTQIVGITMLGTLGKNSGLVGSRAHLTGSGADIAAVAAAFDVPISASSPFSFVGDIELGDSAVTLSDGAYVTVGENRLVASGVIGYGDGQYETDVRGTITGTDLARASRMAGVEGEKIPSRAYEISGHFRIGSEGYKIGGLQARVGDTKLTADGIVSFRDNFVGSHLKFAVAGPKFGEFVTDTETMKFPSGPFAMSGDIELLGNAVRLTGIDVKLGDATATVDADIGLPLAAANGTFEVFASGDSIAAVLPDTGLWEPPDESFEIRAMGKLDDGLLYVEPVGIQIGRGNISAVGVVDLPPDLSRTKLSIQASVANLETIGTFNERRLPNTDFSFDAKFAGTAQSFSIEELVMTSGASDLTGSMIVHLDREVPDVTLKVQSKLLDVTPLLPSPDTDLAADAAEQPVEDGYLIPDWELPLEKLTMFNAAIDVDITAYHQYQREINNLMLDITVRDGRLNVERASGTTTFGNASAKLSVIPNGDAAQVHVAFEGGNLFLGKAGNLTREEIDHSPKYSMSIVLDGSGLTLRELAAGLNGQVKISSDGGRAPNTALRFFYGNFIEELFTAVNPFAKTDPYTEVSCVMLVADIENGRIDAKPGLALQTSKMNIVSEGTIDLRSEKLDLNFKTAPRKKISISAGEFINPYLKVGGTMARPQLMLDPTGTLVSGGAAVATLGLSLVAKAVWDRVFSASDVCAQVAIEAEENRQKAKNKHQSLSAD